jgi:hypothetical protein
VSVWREKARAFAVHFLVTLLFSAAAAALVFLVWFPDPFHQMLGGTRLFEILVMCDLGLGPLSSFIVYSSKKTRRALVFDYTVIGIIQLGAFLYGLHAVANSRPAFIVSVGDRIEVVSAGEIADEDLANGAQGYRTLPLWGPRLVGIQEPQDLKERDKVLWSSLAGKDYPVLPQYYTAYEHTLPQMKQRALPVSELEKRHPEAKALVSDAVAQLQMPVEKLVWLPVRHHSGFWTVLLERETGSPVHWLPVDPY